jgi:hypothetical protein
MIMMLMMDDDHRTATGHPCGCASPSSRDETERI